uniref:Ribosomal_L7Ae domain-containing protein n=1 Tax=Parastrongyloides trichosuri TaxID=131310 RepID=A0A0N4ZU35_PARTI
MGKSNKINRVKFPVKSSLTFNWNHEHNDNDKILQEIANYFKENGFCKNKTSKSTKNDGIKEKNFAEEYQIRSLKAVFGLKQVLKLIEKDKLTCLLIDSSIITHSAISTIMGIKLKLTNKDRFPVFCIPNLSKTLAQQLNYSSISAIGLISAGNDLLPIIRKELKESGIKIKGKR